MGSVGLSPPRSLFIDSWFNSDSKNCSILLSDFFMINDLIFAPTLFLAFRNPLLNSFYMFSAENQKT